MTSVRSAATAGAGPAGVTFAHSAATAGHPQAADPDGRPPPPSDDIGQSAVDAGGRGDPTRGGLTATASVVADVPAGRPRIRWSHAWPIMLRPTGDARIHLVHGAGGPLGGDTLALDVQVATGGTLAVRSAGATIVQPGRGCEPAQWDVHLVVGSGASLDWAPEPTVVIDRAHYQTSLRVELAAGARAVLREVVVLGRHGGVGGRYRGRLDVTVDGTPLLAHTTLLDGADPVLCGPGGTAGGRAIGTLVVVPSPADLPATTDPLAGERPDVRWAWTDLPGPGRALLAVGEPRAVIAILDAAAT
jgi:urease accessory protein